MPPGREKIQTIVEEPEQIEESAPAESESESEEDLVMDETPQETVARLLRETQEADDEDDEVEEAEEEAPASETQSAPEPQEIEPPARFTAEQKEQFNKLPAAQKRQLADMVRQHEGLTTRAVQEARAKEQQAGHVLEVARSYLNGRPELRGEGYTEATLVSALIAAHEKLNNPQTRAEAFVSLGKDLGFDVSALLEGKQNGRSNPPEIQGLQQTVGELKSTVDGWKQSQANQAAAVIVNEIKAAQNEKDASGRYLYPRLHSMQFLEQMKPLVSDLQRTIPGLTVAEAYKRAHRLIDSEQLGNSAQPEPARLPVQNNNKEQRARAAIASVRGKSAPPKNVNANEIPEEAISGSAKDTVKWALQNLRSR